jgi:outer membrane protein OmpA-like peptidoglycan-associated protein
MKKLMICLLLAALSLPDANAQLKDLDKRIGNKVKRKIDQKADRTIDKALDKGERKIDQEVNESVKGDKKKTARERKSNEAAGDGEEDKAVSGALQVNRSTDFTPGTKILFSESFEKDAVNDFPAAWNTTGSGEVVTINNVPGKWLSIPQKTLTYPEHVSTLPENFTIEFDLLIPTENRPPITFGFSDSKNPVKDGIKYKKLFYFRIDHAQDFIGSTNRYYSGGESNQAFRASKLAGKPVHVSMSINKTRIRLYINGEKLFDLPRAFEPAAIRNSFFFRASEITSEKNSFYITNFVVAESGTDARSGIMKELMENGRVSTNDIQFDFNSDAIKPSSYEIVDTLGEALKQNTGLRIRIIGHTDNVGKDDYNKQLSAKRAEAVKTYIVTNFGVSAERVQIEGMGAANPLVPNTTEEGRAKNRRVEFIKL